ncbi:MAG: TniQ family protein [Microlunatus sp.]
MPLRPSPAPANPTRPGPPRLREVPAGYDLGPLPIHVSPRDGEVVVSWLRRVSLRYDVPVRDLLRVAGTSKPITGTSKVLTRLRNNRGLLDRLGLTAEETRRLLAPPPMLAALDDYLNTMRRQWIQPPRWSRYCPLCLADPDPCWDADWQSPLTLLCLRHGVYLVNTCPSCRRHPQASPVWMSQPLELWRCPSRHAHDQGSTRAVHPWCDTDLRDAPTELAHRDIQAAQQLLTSWSAEPLEPATACGLAITRRIGFHAFIELVDAACCGLADTVLQLGNAPHASADSFLAAAYVLTRTTLDDAAIAAARLLSYDGPHAPTRPGMVMESHPYSPLLAGVQLHGIRDRLAPADQLAFRLSHPVGRYPATLSPELRSRLRLPDHRLVRPERDDAWFPQLLWPDAVPAAAGGDRCPVLHRACLAMALAKLGSGRSWAEIAQTLDLPVSIAHSIGAVLQSWVRAGTWPDLLAELDTLLVRLQKAPPPIDYRLRRELGQDIDVLDQALVESQRVHASPLRRPQLIRLFWETFTAGDIGFARSPVALDRTNPEYAAYQQQAAVGRERDRPLLQTAHNAVGRLLDKPLGPMQWSPTQRKTMHIVDGVRVTVDWPPKLATFAGHAPF